MVAGNWKLNGSRESVAALAGEIIDGLTSPSSDIVVCPTAVHLPDVAKLIENSPLHLGAQNCASEASGAFTGEVAAGMLAEFACEYVIVGHSERRQLFGESSVQVAKKVLAVQNASLTPILCVGETLEEREGGSIQAVIDEQLDAVLQLSGIAGFDNMVVAYEPVWAIGTGKTATPDQAQEVHGMIRQKLGQLDADIAGKLRILYGGSVKPDNAVELFSQTDIDGGLIGGAALDAKSFLAICQAAG